MRFHVGSRTLSVAAVADPQPFPPAGERAATVFDAAAGIEKAGHEIASYVTHGDLDDPGQFAETFAYLEGTVPAHLRTCPTTVYRVVGLDAGQAEILREGEPLLLDPRPFGSWTTEEDAARAFMRLRAARTPDDGLLVVVRRDVDPSCCVVDVEALYRHLGWDDPFVHEWAMYVSWEKEVVLRQDEEMREIRPEHVLLALSPTEREVWDPMPGERVWDTEAEDFVYVAEVVAGSGDRHVGFRWDVVTDVGRRIGVRWDARNDCFEATAPTYAPRRRP